MDEELIEIDEDFLKTFLKTIEKYKPELYKAIDDIDKRGLFKSNNWCKMHGLPMRHHNKVARKRKTISIFQSIIDIHFKDLSFPKEFFQDYIDLRKNI